SPAWRLPPWKRGAACAGSGWSGTTTGSATSSNRWCPASRITTSASSGPAGSPCPTSLARVGSPPPPDARASRCTPCPPLCPPPPGPLLRTPTPSHDQFTPTIFGLGARSGGSGGGGGVVLMHAEALAARGRGPGRVVDLPSHFEGQRRTARRFIALAYPI